MTNEDRLSFYSWIMNFPGLFEGASPHECIAKACEASPLDLDAADFKDMLKRFGFHVRCIRNHPQTYRLELGTAGVGVTRTQ